MRIVGIPWQSSGAFTVEGVGSIPGRGTKILKVKLPD